MTRWLQYKKFFSLCFRGCN